VTRYQSAGNDQEKSRASDEKREPMQTFAHSKRHAIHQSRLPPLVKD
jgi:hypothetical protein